MLRALADETRRHILTQIWREERTAGQIAGTFDMSRPAVSQHLGVLLQSGLVSVRREGTRRLYRANRTAINELRARLGTFWDDGLARLKRAAESGAVRNRRR